MPKHSKSELIEALRSAFAMADDVYTEAIADKERHDEDDRAEELEVERERLRETYKQIVEIIKTGRGNEFKI